MSKLSKNLSYQSIYQILTIITPLITAPYLSRVLGAKSLGIFSYSSSIVAYFVLFAMLGTVNYGTKCIAANRNIKQKLSANFWSIYALQVTTSLFLLLLYIFYVVFFCKENINIAYLQSLAVIACVFNVNWLLYGVEDFAVVTIRNIIVKIIEVSAIFVFVNSSEDLYLYIVIMSGGTLVSNLVAFSLLRKYIVFVKIRWSDIIRHVKPNLVLFFPLLAVSVYHIMDKTMLGMLSTYQECGYYYNSDKLINIPLCVLTGVGTVMLPRISNLISRGEHKEVSRLFNISLEMIVAVGIALSFGIASVSNEFVPFFFGKGYDKCIFLTYIFAPILVIKGIVNIIRMLFLIPYDRNIEFLYSVCIGAVVNVICNILFIPKYAALGAVIGTLAAEFSALVFQMYNIRKEYNLGGFIKETGIYIVLGMVMLTSVRLSANCLSDINIAVKLLVEIIIGAVVYGVVLLTYWKKRKREYFQLLLPRFCRKM